LKYSALRKVGGSVDVFMFATLSLILYVSFCFCSSGV